jgi:hypothetical protein
LPKNRIPVAELKRGQSGNRNDRAAPIQSQQARHARS